MVVDQAAMEEALQLVHTLVAWEHQVLHGMLVAQAQDLQDLLQMMV